MNDVMKKNIESLIQRAADHPDADAAMRFTQAAVNAANALNTMRNADDNERRNFAFERRYDSKS